MSEATVTTIAADGPCVVLAVVVRGVAHQVRVSPAGAVLIPAELAQHDQRDDIEAEAREVAAQARLGWVA